MSLIPQVTCRHCGKKFSSLSNSCPNCGARREKQSTRTPAPTASIQPGTAANARAKVNARFQAIFGAVLLVAVVASVIILIVSSLHGTASTGSTSLSTGSKTGTTSTNSTGTSSTGDSTDIITVDPSLSLTTDTDTTDTDTATPTPTPEETITSLEITFLGSLLPGAPDNPGFTTYIGQETNLEYRVYPTGIDVPITWLSDDTSICTVNSDGKVVGVSTGQTYVHCISGSFDYKCLVAVR